MSSRESASPKASRVVFVRHGQSVWNRDRRFTGWEDTELSPTGRQQAERAGRLLRSKGFRFDLAFTSVLSRASDTLDIALAAMGQSPEIEKTWRLNERHYGELQGLPKAEAMQRFGEEQMFRWVRSFDIAPPPVSEAALLKLRADALYADVNVSDLPATESLEDTLVRTLPYWEESIAPAVRAGRDVLVVSHLNCLRALIKHFEGVSNARIATLSIHTGEPFAIDFDEELVPKRRYYLQFRPHLALKRFARKVKRRRGARAWLDTESVSAKA
jgi:2,3-bisphosphoglycerate-dependent phosphoglycerate mutase